MSQKPVQNLVSETPEDASGRSVVSILVGSLIVALFILFCAHYILSHWEDFVFVSSVSFPEMGGAALCILASYFLNALQLHLFLRKFGVSLGCSELTAVTMGMILGNLVIPMRGGTGGLAVYLKRFHGLDFQEFAAIYAGTALLVALINAGLSAAALFFIALYYGLVFRTLTVVVVLLLLSCAYLGVFPPPVNWQQRGILRPIFQAAHSWHILTRDRRLLAVSALLLCIISLLLAGAFHLIYAAIGTPLSLSGVLVTSSLGNVANLVPLTPGSLGIFDAVTIQIPLFFGVDPARSITATLVFRVLCFSWAVVLGIPGMLYLFKSGKGQNY